MFANACCDSRHASPGYKCINHEKHKFAQSGAESTCLQRCMDSSSTPAHRVTICDGPCLWHSVVIQLVFDHSRGGSSSKERARRADADRRWLGHSAGGRCWKTKHSMFAKCWFEHAGKRPGLAEGPTQGTSPPYIASNGRAVHAGRLILGRLLSPNCMAYSCGTPPCLLLCPADKADSINVVCRAVRMAAYSGSYQRS